MHPLLQTNSYAKGGSVAEEVMDAPAADNSGGGDDLTHAADELISAIQTGDAHGVAQALKACFQICDAEPHTEGEHE